MADYRLSKYEQETIISFNAAEDVANIYTADPAWIRKLDKLTEQNPEQFALVKEETYQGTVVSKQYTLPKRFVSVRSKDIRMNLSEEQREERREKARQMVADRKARSCSGNKTTLQE